MYKQHLLNNIEKEIKICRRLSTKIPPDQMHFRPMNGVRSILELLQYLTIIAELMPAYWLQNKDADFESFFAPRVLISKKLLPENFLSAMEEQIKRIRQIFDQIHEDDLYQKEVKYPWAGSLPLGEAIIDTSIKWIAAYKLQLFNLIKLSGNLNLATADAWALTELDQ
jgi:hypothetical protein